MSPSSANPPSVTLSIAGSDNSAGAGVQADLKTFTAFHTYGLTAITCVAAEVPGRVSGVAPIPIDIIRTQIDLCFQAFPVAAAKTGMLYSMEIIETVAAALRDQRAHGAAFPLVIDPVMVASSGDPLLLPGAIDAYRQLLFPLATLVTPNLNEAAVLLGEPIADHRSLEEAGKRLVQKHGCAFLMKGGHFQTPIAKDALITANLEVFWFEAPYIPNVDTHGTGCTYSAAITAGLAKGMDLPGAVERAKNFVTDAIRERFDWPKQGDAGHATTTALNHLRTA
jgi:hydroxymethylpyrimidine/phosphomethylpyrimidine kinase